MAMTAAVHGPASELKSIPKARLIALYVLAVSVGLLPFALVIRSALFLLIAALSVAAVAVIVTRRTIQYAGEDPAEIEIVLGLLGASSFGMICGMLGIFFFILVRLVVAVYEWLILSVPLSAWTPDTAPAESWANTLSLVLPAVMVLLSVVSVCSEDAAGFVTRLYPPLSGQRSSYFALSQQPKQVSLLLIKAFLGAGAIILLASFPLLDQLIQTLSGRSDFLTHLSSLGSVFGLLILNIFWVVFTQELWDTKSPDLSRARNQPLVEKIQTLMEAAGYQVRLYPQTGDKEADPLIALLDFVAIRSDRSMAGRVKGYVDPVLLRRELASLPPTVWALEDQLSKNRSQKEIVLEPVLFLTGGASRTVGSGETSGFATGQDVRIIEVEEAELDEIVGGSDNVKKTDRAKQLVDARATMPTPPPAAGLATA
jgi:hypothetical protein